MIVFRQNTGLPPGGLVFKDPKADKLWNDTSAFMEDRVTEVITFRKQNPSIYDPQRDADFFNREKVMQEITDQNFARLGGNPTYFIDGGNRRVQGFQTAVIEKCDCGALAHQILCASGPPAWGGDCTSRCYWPSALLQGAMDSERHCRVSGHSAAQLRRLRG